MTLIIDVVILRVLKFRTEDDDAVLSLISALILVMELSKTPGVF